MNCPDGNSRFAEYVSGSLHGPQLADYEQHLSQCPECSWDVTLWRRLAALPAPLPGEGLRRGFEQMLERESGRPAWRRYAWPAVAAALLLAFGWLAGTTRPGGKTGEVAQLREEIRSLRESVTLSMLQQQSAIERLRGVQSTRLLDDADPDVIAALSERLQSDPSINVRLAAVEALGRFRKTEQARRVLLDGLSPAQSPLVQLALLDALRGSGDPRLLSLARSTAGRADADENVRRRALRTVQEIEKGVIQ